MYLLLSLFLQNSEIDLVNHQIISSLLLKSSTFFCNNFVSSLFQKLTILFSVSPKFQAPDLQEIFHIFSFFHF